MPRGVNARDTAWLGNRLWVPQDHDRLIHYYSAFEPGTVTTSGSTATDWDDVGPNGYDLSEDGPGTATFGTNYLNGKPVVTTDNGSRVNFTDSVNVGNSYSHIGLCLARVLDHTSQYASLWCYDASTDDYQFEAYSSVFRGNVRSTGLNVSVYNDTTDRTDEWHIFGWRMDNAATDAFMRLDGETTYTDTSITANQFDGTYTFRIGANRGNNQWIEADYACFMAFDAGDRYTTQKAEGYIAHRYGVPSILVDGHPFRNRPPLKGD